MSLLKCTLFLVRFCVSLLLVPLSLQAMRRDSVLTPLFLFSPRQSRCELNVELKKASCGNRGLDSVPQSLSEDILRLDLPGNNITSLLKSSFKRYPLITHLDLSRNDIRVIERTALHPLKDLTNLNISFNLHLVLPDTGLLRWAGKLFILDLQSSNLQSLPNDILRWSPRLYSVQLNRNHLKTVNISSCGGSDYFDLSENQIKSITADTFSLVCHVHRLDLIGNPIQSVDPEVIASLHVRILFIGDYPLTFEVFRNIFFGISKSEIRQISIFSAISAFPKDFFDELRDSPISLLQFSLNSLNFLYPFAFSNLTRVREFILNLNDRPIAKIEPNYFVGMQDLRILKMEYNDLRDINPDGHAWTVDLVELHLDGNRLSDISPYTFLGLRNLTFLDLSLNKGLGTFNVDSFSGLDNLQIIDLSGCSVYRWQLDIPTLKGIYLDYTVYFWSPLVPGESFRKTKSLVNLSLIASELEVSNLFNATLNISVFDGLFDLTILDMGGNLDLSYLPPIIFRQLASLQELSLDYCGISHLHHLTFTGLISLQELDLRGNRFQQLHPDIFQGLVQVTSIDLQENLLSFLDEAIFSKNSRLAKLSLANNKFTSFNQSTFQPIESSLSSIDLSLNPINCNCGLKWLLDWIKGHVHLINEDKTICSLASLDSVREKPVLDFDPDKLCRLNTVLFCVLPLAAIGVVIVAGLIYHHRWQLRFKLYLLKLAVLGYKELRDARDHNDYEFDLNIIFYDDDEEWIRERLRPALEERLPQFQRNLFGDEDLVLGMHYLDSVDYVVSRSYKTVVVLSRAAVRDRWFMLKLRIAMDHVSDTQTEFVVVVFLEDIPDAEMPFLARLYLSDGRPYIYWTNDERGQEYFWNELVKNLTINLRTNDLIPNE